MKRILNLTGPTGRVAISMDAITAITEVKDGPITKTRVWVLNSEDAFNIQEEYEDVISLLSPMSSDVEIPPKLSKPSSNSKTIDDYEDCNIFKPGEVWYSPQGSMWKVESVKIGGEAILRKGRNGFGSKGTKHARRWDAVASWVRIEPARSAETQKENE